jgi:hypothetical protein
VVVYGVFQFNVSLLLCLCISCGIFIIFIHICNTPSNLWTSGTYSWQLSRIIYCPHRPTRAFCAHFVLTQAHPRKLSGRSPIPNCSKPSTLNLEVLSRKTSEKKMHLVGMITLLILLSLGPGHPIPGARIS